MARTDHLVCITVQAVEVLRSPVWGTRWKYLRVEEDRHGDFVSSLNASDCIDSEDSGIVQDVIA